MSGKSTLEVLSRLLRFIPEVRGLTWFIRGFDINLLGLGGRESSLRRGASHGGYVGREATRYTHHPVYVPIHHPGIHPVHHPGYTSHTSMLHWVSALHWPWRDSNTLGSTREKPMGRGLSPSFRSSRV